MNRKNVFVCATIVTLVMGFASIASASPAESAASVDDPVVSYEDTPYIDAEGNIDYELAKDYAELVDSYTDESGTKWEVWLDELGGHMWTESFTVDGILGIEDLFVPYYVRVYRSGLATVNYTVPGTACGYIWYAGSCGKSCYKWDLCSDSSQYSCDPDDITQIDAEATSDDDYCDANYVAYYNFPDNNPTTFWEVTDDKDCWTTSGTSYYWMTDDDPNGDDDYGIEGMVRWQYRISGSTYNTKVFYYGPCII